MGGRKPRIGRSCEGGHRSCCGWHGEGDRIDLRPCRSLLSDLSRTPVEFAANGGRTVVIVSPHFPPSNLAGVHRARILSQHLEEFGWRPIIVTTDPRHYEEALDPGLAGLVDPYLEIVRTPALPTRPVRVVGDIGVRSLPYHLAALRRLRAEGRMDFLLITIPSFFSAILGELLHREKPLPFGIDYQDPWVHRWPGTEVPLSKAWASMKLGECLEPFAVRHARLITSVAPGYLDGLRQRHPRLSEQAVVDSMPIGFSARDFDPRNFAKVRPSQFDPGDGLFHAVYAGAMLPKARSVLERILAGLNALRDQSPEQANRIRLHFIGTGTSPQDPRGYAVLPVAQRVGVADLVTEHPDRMSYFEVLANLTHSSGVLIVGSTEAHYSPSKVYQAVQSRRPVLAFLHPASTAVEVLNGSGAGRVVLVEEEKLPTAGEVADALLGMVQAPYDPDAVHWGRFDAYSARSVARRMAACLDEAIAK
ncbi:glycosyltransferase family protein [Alsobacter sp. R-9]